MEDDGYTVSGNGANVDFSNSTAFSIEFEQTGLAPHGEVTIDGDAAAGDLGSSTWAQAKVRFIDSASSNDTWKLTVTQDGQSHTYTSSSNSRNTNGNALDVCDRWGWKCRIRRELQ